MPRLWKRSSLSLLKFPTYNYTGAGKLMVENWYKQNMDLLSTDTREFIAAFATSVLPNLKANHQVREKSAVALSEPLRIQYLAKLKSLGCKEDMFWSISETKEINAISEKSGDEVNDWKSAKPHHINHALVCVVKNLQENPNMCPNCFGEHELSACKKMSPSSLDNLAAWIIPSFRQDTKATGQVHHKQSSIAKLITSLCK
ncbi:hypothetical protein OXX80_005732 [Metschnikowia pulcherrima]